MHVRDLAEMLCRRLKDEGVRIVKSENLRGGATSPLLFVMQSRALESPFLYAPKIKLGGNSAWTRLYKG